MPWSEQDLIIISELRKSCLIHMYLQSSSAHFFLVINNLISIPNIILNAIMSVTIFSTSNNNQWHTIGGIFAICCTILASLNKQIIPGEKSQLHCYVARQYERIYRDIKMNLNILDTETLQRAFVSSIKDDLDHVFSIQPNPPLIVLHYFMRKYGSTAEKIMYPELENFEHQCLEKHKRITERITERVSRRTSKGGPKTVRFTTSPDS